MESPAPSDHPDGYEIALAVKDPPVGVAGFVWEDLNASTVNNEEPSEPVPVWIALTLFASVSKPSHCATETPFYSIADLISFVALETLFK